jgi:hypothetical protein
MRARPPHRRPVAGKSKAEATDVADTVRRNRRNETQGDMTTTTCVCVREGPAEAQSGNYSSCGCCWTALELLLLLLLLGWIESWIPILFGGTVQR